MAELAEILNKNGGNAAEDADPPKNQQQDPPADPPSNDDDDIDVESLLAQREQHQQDIAAQHGWKPLDEWVRGGGDPNEWRPAGEFNQVGEFGRKLKQRDQAHNEELQGVNKIVAAQRKVLERQLDQAVEAGDKDAAKVIREDISNLEQPVARKPQEVIDWELRNPDVYEDTPKGAFMREQWARMLPDVHAGRKSMADALQALDQKVEAAFPKPAQSRGKVPAAERGNGSRGVRQSNKAITMDDLTQEEAYLWKSCKSMWKGDEKAFLKSVQASRKEA